jgi:hypothetical protein
MPEQMDLDVLRKKHTMKDVMELANHNVIVYLCLKHQFMLELTNEQTLMAMVLLMDQETAILKKQLEDCVNNSVRPIILNIGK